MTQTQTYSFFFTQGFNSRSSRHYTCLKIDYGRWEPDCSRKINENYSTLQIFRVLQVNYRKMMVDVTRKTYYSLVAHQKIVGFSCCSYMKLQVCTVIYYCYYHQTTRVQSGQCRMPLLLQAKYLQYRACK